MIEVRMVTRLRILAVLHVVSRYRSGQSQVSQKAVPRLYRGWSTPGDNTGVCLEYVPATLILSNAGNRPL
jgi:hypothetical protein